MKNQCHHQIIDKNSRQGDRTRLGMEFILRIDELQRSIETFSKTSSTFIDFIPIRLVAILEVFLKGIISELVDSDEKYFERGQSLPKNAKIDLALFAHVNRREFTVGDFISHNASLGNLDSILGALDKLLEGFSAKLKISHPRWTENINEWPLPPIIKDYDSTMATLARLYEVRHILAHELPLTPILEPDDLPHFIAAAKTFVEATDWVVVEALHGDVPRTQSAMNLKASNDMGQEEARLTQTITDIAALDGIDQQALHELYKHWTTWANAQATLVASQAEGGSMYPMMWASEKTELTREWIDQLTRLKKQRLSH